MNDRPEATVKAETVINKLRQFAQAEVPADSGDSTTPAGIVPAPQLDTKNATAKPNSPFAVEKPAAIDQASVKLTITPVAGQPVVLPADTQIAAILVNGEDLIIREADGDLIVINAISVFCIPETITKHIMLLLKTTFFLILLI